MWADPLGVEPLCHADHFVVFVPRSSNRRREMQVFLLQLLPLSCLSVCLHVHEFGRTSLQGELCKEDAPLPACLWFSVAKKDVDHPSVKDQSEVWIRISLPVCRALCSTCSIDVF